MTLPLAHMLIVAPKREVWWIGAIEALVILNALLLTFAFMTLIERKAVSYTHLTLPTKRIV